MTWYPTPVAASDIVTVTDSDAGAAIAGRVALGRSEIIKHSASNIASSRGVEFGFVCAFVCAFAFDFAFVCVFAFEFVFAFVCAIAFVFCMIEALSFQIVRRTTNKKAVTA